LHISKTLVLYNAANALHKSFELIKSPRNVLNISTQTVQYPADISDSLQL